MRECQSLSHAKWNCKYHVVVHTEKKKESDIWQDAQAFRANVS